MDPEAIRQILLFDMDAARDGMRAASHRFDHVFRNLAGEPVNEDSILEIRNATQGLAEARKNYLRAFDRLNEFIKSGSFPDDLICLSDS